MPRLATDQRIGTYRVVRLIGEGGMGAVYEVLDTTLDRRAALKILHADATTDPQLAARFLLEAKAVGRVRHPGVIQIYGYDQSDDGLLYFIMEYLDGESLSARFRRYAKSPAGRYGLPCLLLIQQVARALAAVHKEGFVHRDLKPGNIMLVSDPDVRGGERAKVLDFGIAKAMAQPDGTAAVSGVEIKTRTGLLLGTPSYMAPEQFKNQKVDGKTDVYALGLIAVEALIGRLPCSAEDLVALAYWHCFEPPPALATLDPSLPPALCALVERMLAKDPAARPTMSEVADGIGAVLDLPIELGKPAALHSPEPLSTQAKEVLEVEHPTISDVGPASNLAPALSPSATSSPAATPASPLPQISPISPAVNVPVEIAAFPTAPTQSSQSSQPSPTAPKRTVSFTAPTLNPVPASSRWLPAVVILGLVGGAGTWAALHDWQPKPAPIRRDLGPPPALSAPALVMDLSLAPDLSRPSEPLQSVEPTHPRPHSHCSSRPAHSCILTAMPQPELEDLRMALREGDGVHLCPGERLVLTGIPRKPRILEAPPSLKGQALDLFLNALRGLDPARKFPVKVEIECSRQR